MSDLYTLECLARHRIASLLVEAEHDRRLRAMSGPTARNSVMSDRLASLSRPTTFDSPPGGSSEVGCRRAPGFWGHL